MGLGAPDQSHNVAAEFRTGSPPGVVVDVEPDELPARTYGDGEKAVLTTRLTDQRSHPAGQIDGAVCPRIDTGDPRIQPLLGRIDIAHDAGPMGEL